MHNLDCFKYFLFTVTAIYNFYQPNWISDVILYFLLLLFCWLAPASTLMISCNLLTLLINYLSPGIVLSVESPVATKQNIFYTGNNHHHLTLGLDHQPQFHGHLQSNYSWTSPRVDIRDHTDWCRGHNGVDTVQGGTLDTGL